MDDVTFCRSGPYGDAWLAAWRYWGGVWCLRMPCFYTVMRTLLYSIVLYCSALLAFMCNKWMMMLLLMMMITNTVVGLNSRNTIIIHCQSRQLTIVCTKLTLSTPAVPNCCCSKGPAPYWSNPPFLISDIRALWRSVLRARAPECQKLKMVGYTSMAKCKALTGSAVKGLKYWVHKQHYHWNC